MEYGYILPTIEVLIINLVTLNHCFKRKYSLPKTIAALCIFTVFCVFPWTLPAREIFSGNGRFSILGFIYIIPIKLLYDEKLEMLFLSMCMSWTYTMGIMAISTQAAYCLGDLNHDLSLLFIETLLFLITFIPFKRSMIPQYFYILRSPHKVPKTQFAYLKINIYLHFFTLFMLHLVFLGGDAHGLQIAILVLLLASNCLFYRIVYAVISSTMQITELKKTVSNDTLTGLGNRTKAIKDMRSHMEANRVFSILFLDLDRFKLVNDQYGHDVGDRYLIHFGKVFSEALNGRGTLYRYAGDEFVALCDGELTEEMVSSMTQCKNWDEGAPCAFNRVSAGLVVCKPPYACDDPSDLLRRADSLMYRNKPNRKTRMASSGESDARPPV